MYDTVRGESSVAPARWLYSACDSVSLTPGVINKLRTWAKGIFFSTSPIVHPLKKNIADVLLSERFFFNWISEPCYHHSSSSSSSSSRGFVRSLLVLRGVCRSSLKRRREGERRSACTFSFSSFGCGLDQCSGSVWTGGRCSQASLHSFVWTGRPVPEDPAGLMTLLRLSKGEWL